MPDDPPAGERTTQIMALSVSISDSRKALLKTIELAREATPKRSGGVAALLNALQAIDAAETMLKKEVNQ